MFKKEANLFYLSLRDSFIGIFPYFVLHGTLILAIQLLGILELDVLTAADAEALLNVSFSFLPLIIIVSIAYHFSIRYAVDNVVSIILALVTSLSISAMTQTELNSRSLLSGNPTLLTLLIPVTSTLLMAYCLKYFKNMRRKYSTYSNQVNNMFDSIYVFVVSYFICVSLFVFFLNLDLGFNTSFLKELDIGSDSLFFLRTLLIDVFWFFGIHGLHAFNILFGDQFLADFAFDGLTYKHVSELYVFLGGSGATLGLVISILINRNDKHSVKIAKLAAPFSLFNINEILVFGLPIILNKNFLLPFIAVPVINLLISFTVLSFYTIPVVSEVSWTTPIFLNAYFATDGNPMAIVLQAILLIIDVWVYSYYFKRYTMFQSNELRYNNLASSLDIIPRLKSREDISANKAQTSIIKSNHKVNEITKLLNTETLMVYYQPKINVLSGTCNHYEALLRLKMSDGKVSGPFFLENLEVAGLAPIIDLWVCKEVKRQLGSLKSLGMNPKISINIHPDTISDEYAIKDIQGILKGENIEFEIIERKLLSSDRAKKNLFSLKEQGFSISIDDFGIGYTSFETLHTLPIDVVKLDKSLIDIIDQKKGFLICRHIANLCASLGYDIVAEGVETKEQLDVLKRLDIKYIQGYYFSPAIPMEEMREFKVVFSET